MLALAFMEVAVDEPSTIDLTPAGFRVFYDAALPRVYGYFLHRCGGRADVAEDLTQETFLAAVRELRRGRRPETPIAWLFGIARHKLLDHYRRQERAGVDIEPPAEAYHDDEEDPTRERAVAALAAVAPAQRAALVLCYVDGFAVREAAELLGKSVAAVNSLLDRGRASFKRAYAEAPV